MALAFRSYDHRAARTEHHARLARHRGLELIKNTFRAPEDGTITEEAAAIPAPVIFAGLDDASTDSGSESAAAVKAALEGDLEPSPPLPSVAECAVHLEMLEAFVILKQKILTSNGLDRAFGIIPTHTAMATIRGRGVRWVRKDDPKFAPHRLQKWSAYVRLAAARFLAWWDALDEILFSGDRASVMPETALPPLGTCETSTA